MQYQLEAQADQNATINCSNYYHHFSHLCAAQQHKRKIKSNFLLFKYKDLKP